MTTMKISQEAWDSLWENSSGQQERMFDENGVPLSKRPSSNPATASGVLALYRILILPLSGYYSSGFHSSGPLLKTSKKS